MNLGLGGYLKKNGYHESFDIMLRHVERVARWPESTALSQ